MNILNFIADNSVFLLGTITAIKGVYEYSQKRKFEKNLFLHEQINRFFNIDEVKVVHKLLDWNATKVQYMETEYYFDDASILAGMQTQEKKTKYNEKEVIIRKVFDKYFDELNHLIILKDCNLIQEANLRRFLKYWIDILKGDKRNKPKIVITSILQYLDYYDYKEVKNFILK